jgi:hypothetical protein
MYPQILHQRLQRSHQISTRVAHVPDFVIDGPARHPSARNNASGQQEHHHRRHCQRAERDGAAVDQTAISTTAVMKNERWVSQ